jgi:uncharacterized membrane protein YeaQ/YmgE (transglycosylase-associated protein family)
MGLLAWIVFGALAGWAANLIVGGKDRRSQGCLGSVLVGVIGSFLGGLGYQAITGTKKYFEFNFSSFGVAVLGTIVLLVILQLVGGSKRIRPPRDH